MDGGRDEESPTSARSGTRSLWRSCSLGTAPWQGRPPKENRKVNQTLRIDPDVLEAYRQEGTGWQTRINVVLRQHMPQRRTGR
jgi:uncharacterized protein (DUF4415 family)